MEAFVRRLIRRLHDPSAPLSRNRHFHTFETPEGRKALKASRRLKSLQRDILACAEQGRPPKVSSTVGEDGERRIELSLERIKGRRIALLEADEFDLLAELPGVRESLEARPGPG
jgi:hypothetical protein